MLITPEEYAANLQGFAVVDCVARGREIFYFIARETGAGDEPVVDSGLGAQAAKTRVVVCMRAKAAGERWSHAQLEGMNGLLAGASAKPLSQFVGVDADGDVYVLGSGQHRMETRIPAGPDGPRRGRVSRVRMIAGEVYIVGSKRGLARRVGEDRWMSLCPPVAIDPKAAGDEYRLTRDWGFADADGFAADDLYAAGGVGDLWHIGAGSFRKIPISAPLRFESVCCGGDGLVYLGAQSGFLVAGRDDDWRVLDQGVAGEPFHDLVWHEGVLYGGNRHGLWSWQGGRMQAVELPDGIAGCAAHLSVHDGVLLMAGQRGAAILEGGRWNLVFRVRDAGRASENAAPAAAVRQPGRRPPRQRADAAPSIAPSWTATLAAYQAAFEAKRRALGPAAPAWMHEQLDMLFGCRRWPADTESALTNLEARLGVDLPAPLRALWREHGAFALFDAACWHSLEIHPVARLGNDVDGGTLGADLFEALCLHGARWEFERGLTAVQAATLRENFRVFGIARVDDSDCDLLVFDRDGRIGRVHYRHDWAHFNGEAWAAEFLPLLEGRMRVIDLDEELCARIATCEDKLARWMPG